MGLAGKVKEIEHDFRHTSHSCDEEPSTGYIKGRLSCRPETEKSDKIIAL